MLYLQLCCKYLQNRVWVAFVFLLGHQIQCLLLMRGIPNVFGQLSMNSTVWTLLQLYPLILRQDPLSQTSPHLLQIRCCYYKTLQTYREVKEVKNPSKIAFNHSDFMNADLLSYYSSFWFLKTYKYFRYSCELFNPILFLLPQRRSLSH